jgi:hypothetical protein
MNDYPDWHRDSYVAEMGPALRPRRRTRTALRAAVLLVLVAVIAGSTTALAALPTVGTSTSPERSSR